MPEHTVQLRSVKRKFKTVSKRGRNVSFRHREGFSDAKAAEDFFPSQGTEVQRPEQVPASGTNRHKWRLE